MKTAGEQVKIQRIFGFLQGIGNTFFNGGIDKPFREFLAARGVARPRRGERRECHGNLTAPPANVSWSHVKSNVSMSHVKSHVSRLSSHVTPSSHRALVPPLAKREPARGRETLDVRREWVRRET